MFFFLCLRGLRWNLSSNSMRMSASTSPTSCRILPEMRCSTSLPQRVIICVASILTLFSCILFNVARDLEDLGPFLIVEPPLPDDFPTTCNADFLEVEPSVLLSFEKLMLGFSFGPFFILGVIYVVKGTGWMRAGARHHPTAHLFPGRLLGV